ncbi:AdoMet_MTases domain containing protein [uncultured Caudovirales phage]|uniref:AdoMet_MTases domain containing protein n=1 Tax=uncultured Caudovirales phage TaxID=2100421 RepID=A0A6J5P5R4_9CAUD|nr:AdoMet_MTases domain containing protein [uncultured Caudovirales phage]
MSMQTKLIHSDCLEALKNLPDNSVDSVVTDPPYGLSFMGKKWDYDVPSEEIWAECLRVLKPGGHLLAFAGTRTQHRMAVRIEDAGFEIRDMIAWVYGSGFPKSHNLKDQWQGWGTALKPALEPITKARKPLIGTVAENVLAHGTGAINIDGCRVRGGSETGGEKPVYAANHGNAVYGTGMGGGARANTDGRWPANLIHDGSEEVLAGFPQSSTTGVRRQPERVQQDVRATPFTRGKASPEYTDSGSAARFFYCAKASKRDRDEGNTHPTVKPTDLMRYLVRLVTPPNGTVLDPFMGSGSTGKAAMLEGFNFIGIEREAEYIEIAKARINWTLLC